MEFKEYMKDWILNDLSSPIAALNNFSKCPYAKTAFLENKVHFFEIDDYPEIDTIVSSWDNEKMEVAVIKLPPITSNYITTLVDNLNERYIPDDFIFLDDHVDNEERMNEIVFNNGKYNVLFLQRKSKLDLSTKKLEKLGYYKNWTTDYYEEVVGWRS